VLELRLAAHAAPARPALTSMGRATILSA
jgi:hypothetical protein